VAAKGFAFRAKTATLRRKTAVENGGREIMQASNTSNLWTDSNGERPCAPELDQNAEADLVIIGGGFTGCAAALQAAEAGARVVLLEAERIGHGGSGRNVGLVNAGLWTPPEEITARLGDGAARRLNSLLATAPEAVFRLIEAHGIACEPVRNGTLHCAHAPRGFGDLQTRHRQLRAIGAPVELLDGAAARARVGSARVHGALFDPRAGTIQPLAYACGLARAAEQAGARIAQHSPAVQVARDGAGWRVTTPKAHVRAGALLLAQNAYAQSDLHLSRQDFVPVDFFQVATAPLSAAQRDGILPGGEGCWDTAQVMASYRLDQAGRLIIGGIGSLQTPGSRVHRGWARRKLAEMFPQAAAAEITHAWCGRIAMTADHLPKIVRFGSAQGGPAGLACFGYSGRGIGPGTLFGQAAAQALLLGDTSGLPLVPVASHAEPLRRAKQGFYEVGALLVHLAGARGISSRRS